MPDIVFEFEKGAKRGYSADNTHSVGTSVHTGGREKVNTISYTILAASISEALATKEFTLTMGTTETITIMNALPTTDTLLSLFNAGVAEAFPDEEDPPQMVRLSDGYYIVNPSSTAAEFTFPNTNTQVLYLGENATQGSYTFTVIAGGNFGAFTPSSRLGATNMQLRIEQGSTGGIKLPITGHHLDGVLFYPPANFTVNLASTSSIATLSTSYVAVNSRIEEVTPIRTEIVVTIE